MTKLPDGPPRRAVIITGPGFQDEEFIYPFYRLQEAGFMVDVAIKDKAVVHGKYGIPARATIDTKDLKEEDFDLVLLPGGHEAPDRVRQDKHVLNFVKKMDEKKKIIAAICHGPWMLISANVVRGRRATAYISIDDDMKNAGALDVEAPVVEDDNLITSPHYRDNGDFMRAVIHKFKKTG